MHVLFLHQAFPGQFGRLALELKRRYGWRCTFLVEKAGTCPSPTAEELAELTCYPITGNWPRGEITPWSQTFMRSLQQGQAVFDALKALPELRPDLLVAHQTLAPTLFLPEIVSCPIVHYCEYYYAFARRDLSFRVDLPPAQPTSFYPRCINAPILLEMTTCDAGYAPTHWQKHCYPERFWPKIEVHFDGIDTQLYRPRQVPRDQIATLLGGRSVPESTRLVTFVARGLESMRGFDVFLQVARKISRLRSDVLFVVVGAEQSYYGWDRLRVGRASFKEWALEQGDWDRSRFIFLAPIDPAQLGVLLARSDLHLYMTVPFVLSWSLFDALASDCVVLASDVGPVREVVEPGVNGLVENLFDIDALVRTSLRVLDDPPAFQPLALAGRELIEKQYSLEVAVPQLKKYFERQAR
jgi:glycosyltransferase involved in cell wall biosynthesis